MGWRKVAMIAAGVALAAMVLLIALVRELGRFADDVGAFRNEEVDDDGIDGDE